MTLTLYNAARCPYAARARIALAEKGVEVEVVEIDLSDRPAWLYEKNPTGRVPVLEEDDRPLPESAVIMEFLDERYPEPALLPADPADRAHVRCLIFRDDEFTDPYYAFRRGEGFEEFDKAPAPVRRDAGRAAVPRRRGVLASPTSRSSRGSCARATCSTSTSSRIRRSPRGSSGSRSVPRSRRKAGIVAAL